jgi:hypothetical protein
MNRISLLATTIVAALVSTLGLFSVAPAAFATELAPPDGTGTVTTSVASGSSGMAGWEIAVIAIAAALLAAVATAVIQQLRFRTTLQAATA